jgi:hypothetical protein
MSLYRNLSLQRRLRLRDCINPAPQTIRADMTRRLAFKLLDHSPYLLVTDSEGRFLGRFVP